MLSNSFTPNGAKVSHLNTEDLFLAKSVSRFDTKYSNSDTIDLNTAQMKAKSTG